MRVKRWLRPSILLLFAHFMAECQPTGAATNPPVPNLEARAIRLRQALMSPNPALEGGVDESARGKLKAILAAPEFAQTMREPSAWERWERQFGAWLGKKLEFLIRSIARHPTTSQAIFWTAALGSLALIALQLFRLFRTGAISPPQLPNAESPSVQSSAEWLSAARSAAQRGDLNRGIQCSYWAGIVCLQDAGTLPKSAGHTPRELLRALQVPAATGDLRNLTLSLERFWYGRTPATADDFAASLRSVEALGCKLD